MDSSNLKVCLAPLNILWGDKSVNLDRLYHLTDEMHPETDLLILPETFSTGYPAGMTLDEVQEIAEDMNGATVEILKRLASRHNIAIVCSLIIKENGKLYNRILFIEPSGEIFSADKAHLFRMGGENEVLEKGSRRLTLRFRGWNISIIVCYDLRFPVWCRNKNNEYDLLVVVANWPKVRTFVWETLLAARAIENLSYVCGVNCKGFDFSKNEYNGCSLALDFKGKEISVEVKDSDLKYAVLNKDSLLKFRDKFPVWMDADNFKILNE